MKKLFKYIYYFFYRFFIGLHSADKVIFDNSSSLNTDGLNTERSQEQDSVYKDLLKGEITQNVRELRHEMYYTERASHQYKYNGGSLAKKKNNLFSYQGVISNINDLPIQIIQENKIDCGSLDDNLKEAITNIQVERKATINISRSFLPRFKIEQYTTKIVVKRLNKNEVLFDLYISKYPSQFDRLYNMFLVNIDKIYQGDKKSDIVDFDELSFVTFNAYGSEDYKRYTYNNISYNNIVEFSENESKEKNLYILTFHANIKEDGYDMLNEFYDEIADKKFKNKDKRNKEASIDFINASYELNDKYDYEAAKTLIDKLSKN